ncbi:MAG: hypothetical protein QM571_05730 [Micrococcaceae bacterium]
MVLTVTGKELVNSYTASAQGREGGIEVSASDNTSTPAQEATPAQQQAVVPAQDSTVTDTTAGVASSKAVTSNDNSMIALVGGATIAAVGTGTFIVRRKKVSN